MNKAKVIKDLIEYASKKDLTYEEMESLGTVAHCVMMGPIYPDLICKEILTVKPIEKE